MRTNLIANTYIIPITALSSVILYHAYFIELVSKVNDLLDGNFDTSIPAYPLVALFFLVFCILLRYKDITSSEEKSELSYNYIIRMLGFLLIVLPALSSSILYGYVDQMEFSAIAIVSCWFGLTILLKPYLLRRLLPYVTAFALCTVFVSLATPNLGYYLSVVETKISSFLTFLLRIPISWHSTSFLLTTESGNLLNQPITAACSGVASFSMLLLILVLLHFATNAKLSFTAKFGILAIPPLLMVNSARIVTMLWAGYSFGISTFWSLHGWFGYLLYSVYYAVIKYLFVTVSCSFKSNRLSDSSS
jgi:exosortase/archaeosortase family protein